MNYKEALQNASQVAQVISKGLNPFDILIFGSIARKKKEINDIDIFLVVENTGDFSRISNQYPGNWPDNYREGCEEDLLYRFFLGIEGLGIEVPSPIEDFPCNVDIIFLPRDVITSYHAWKEFNSSQPDKHFLNNAFKHLLRWKNGKWVPVKRIQLIKEYKKIN